MTTLDASEKQHEDPRQRRIPLVLAACLGILLTLPSLWVGFAQDDYIFLTIFRGAPEMPVLEQSVWDTYTFSEGDTERNRERMERGVLPWWAVPEWKVDMWRPLPSLSHWLDFQIFGENPLPMHAHSILLYGVVCLVVGLFFRSLLGPAALLGALLFAVDAAHGITVGWLSNRHALFMTGLAALSLMAHHHWRQKATWAAPWGPWRWQGMLALAALGLALFCSEGAVGLGGYFFAYALFLDPLARTTPDGRPCALNGKGLACAVAALLPYLGAVVVWRGIYSGLGHGTLGSWLYTDPAREPGAFLQNLPTYFPLSLFGLFGAPDSTLWLAVPPAQRGAVLAGVLGYLAFMAWGLRHVLRTQPQARFLALGCLLAVVPPCSTLPSDRNLMLASVGAMGLLGLALHNHLQQPNPRPTGARIFFAVCVAVHLIVSTIQLPGASYSIAYMDRAFKHVNQSAVPADPDSHTRYVALNTPVDLLGASLPIFRAAMGQPQPARWWWLCAGPEPVEVERIGLNELVLRPEGGFLQQPFGQIFRWPDGYPMKAGDEVALDGLTARVLRASDDGRPLEVQFTFSAPLDSPDYRWLTWSDGNYVPVSLPEPGDTMEVPGLDMELVWLRLIEQFAPGGTTADN